ncbi:MAG: SDR family oxidoreductase [Ruminococcaceae bacterium]|nr:SDR family oxidoreductase [Oscillospiraceae bacterium]
MKGKVAVLTGAGGGIGSAIADMLFSLGCRLVLMGRNEAKLKQTAKGRECLILPGDLCDDAYIQNTIDKTVKAYGGIDYLINNAGVAQAGPFEDVSMEDYDRVMNTNVRAPFLMCKTALPHLMKSSCATIINIASVTAHQGYALQSVYAASKHALLGFSKALSKEYYEKGVRVHVISPGAVFTDMVKISRPDLTGVGMLLPEDIAETVSYLIKMRDSAAVIDEIQLHRETKEPFMF